MWTIQLLGGLAARGPHRNATRFRTRKTAALLAYLAYHCRQGAQPCPREVLIELFWPETDLGAGRHNLSNALSALRHVLEPPGVQPGAVLLADRNAVGLNAGAVTTDVARFEALARRCVDPGEPEPERTALLGAAAAEYGGRLLPGFYEEWITPEAERIAGLFLRLTRDAAPLLRARGDWNLLLSCAQRAAADDPWSEEAVQLLMEALAAVGDPSRALRHYRDFERRLRDDLGSEPAPGLQQFAAELRLIRGRASAAIEAQPTLPRIQISSPTPPEPAADEESTLRGTAFAALTVTRFFDREEETRILMELLRAPRSRLVTLTGPGGAGKTRLALETARGLVCTEPLRHSREVGRPTSVTFVPLAELREGERLPEVLLRSLGIIPQPGRDPLDQAADALDREAAPLLVLDNFEHLVETGAEHVSSLLARVPRARCLVTSRQKLLIEGERELPLSPLPTLPRDRSLEALAETPSVQLFIDRAQMSRPDFQLTPRNAEVVAELCCHVEGLPLAVELAAARVSLLTPAQILEGIRRDRLDFLVSRRRDTVARQRTLRSTLEWSYDLLPPEARRFLAQVSVFRAGWTLEAATAIRGEVAGEDCLELLAVLRDASLLSIQDTEGGLRFALLETVRQYAGERLAASGKTECLRRTHAGYFTELAEREGSLLRTAHHGEAMIRLRREQENLRGAVEWCIKVGEHSLRARLGTALMKFWVMQGYSEQALTWFGDVMEVARNGAPLCALTEAVPPSLRVRLLHALVVLTFSTGKGVENAVLTQWALSLSRDSGDPAAQSEVLMSWAFDPVHRGKAESLTIVEESLRLAREASQDRLVARALEIKAYLLHQVRGELELAAAANREALALFRVLGDPVGIGDVLVNRADASMRDDYDFIASRRDLEENLAIRRRIGDEVGVGIALQHLANLAWYQEEFPEARAHSQRALAILEQTGWSRSIPYAHVLLFLAAVAGKEQRAAEAWSCNQRALGVLLENRLFTAAAECLEDLAGQSLQAGDATCAARLAGAADRHHPLGGSVGAPAERRVLQLVRDVEAVLGRDACARELAVGDGLSNAELLELIAARLPAE